MPAPLRIGLRGLCPRCGASTLFAVLARVAPSCRACGLDYARLLTGDRAAALPVLIVAALIGYLAIAFDERVSPPLWLHVMLWVPLTAASVATTLRLWKGMLLARAYRRKDQGMEDARR